MSDERIIPYISKEEVKGKLKNLLTSKGYPGNEITEDIVFDLGEDYGIVLIDLLVKIQGFNKILILCDSPSETITLTARLAVLISKLLHPSPRIAIATNWMETEATDLLTNRKWYSLEIPSREEMEKIENPSFEFSDEQKEKMKRVISGLYSMKCRKCGIRFE